MNLFSRTVHMSGPASEVGAHALGICEYVSKKTGMELSLWSALFGAPFGTTMFVGQVDGHAGLAKVREALAGDAGYEAMIAKGAGYLTGPPVDMLREAVDGSEPGDPPPIGSIAVVTTAIITDGKYTEAIGWALEVGAHVGTVSGMPVTLYMDLYGTFGQLTWIAVAPDGAAVDAANAKINADAAYIDMLSAAGKLFVPGLAHRSAATRVG